MNEYRLHVFELSYLLSLMRVESVAALPDAILFPKDPSVRKKVLADGQKRLIDAGLAVPDDSGNASYDDVLLSMTAAIADPRLAILTRRDTPSGGRADATIFFNNVEIVEVTQVERHVFRLRRIADPTLAFQSVRKMVEVSPESPAEPVQVDLGVTAFEQFRRHLLSKEVTESIDVLVHAEIPDAVARRIAAVIGSPRRKAVVSILQIVSQRVVDVRVLGCYFDEANAWVTTVVADPHERIRIETADAERFLTRLIDRFASFGE